MAASPAPRSPWPQAAGLPVSSHHLLCGSRRLGFSPKVRNATCGPPSGGCHPSPRPILGFQLFHRQLPAARSEGPLLPPDTASAFLCTDLGDTLTLLLPPGRLLCALPQARSIPAQEGLLPSPCPAPRRARHPARGPASGIQWLRGQARSSLSPCVRWGPAGGWQASGRAAPPTEPPNVSLQEGGGAGLCLHLMHRLDSAVCTASRLGAPAVGLGWEPPAAWGWGGCPHGPRCPPALSTCKAARRHPHTVAWGHREERKSWLPLPGLRSVAGLEGRAPPPPRQRTGWWWQRWARARWLPPCAPTHPPTHGSALGQREAPCRSRC